MTSITKLAARIRNCDRSSARDNAPHGPLGYLSALVLLALAATAIWATPAQAQTITLSGTTTTTPFREYATRVLADPWDMSQRTDLGWFTWSSDSPASHLTNMAIATDALGNTYFRSTASSDDNWFFLLDPWTPGAAKIGKLGVNYPIDTTIYNTLYIKAKIANQVLNSWAVARVIWSRDTIYAPGTQGQVSQYGGQILAEKANGAWTGVPLTNALSQPYTSLEGGSWVIYKIPLTIAQMNTLNADADHWHNVNGGENSNWGDSGVTADSMRLSLVNASGSTVGEVQIDWARLVSYSAGNAMTVSWSPAGTYDVVISTQSNCSDFAVIAYSQSSGYQLQTQMLPAGTYHVGLRLPFTNNGQTAGDGGRTLASCSSQTFTVQSYPSLTMTSPNVEGSLDDFATTQLGDAWDFNALTDIDYKVNEDLPDATYGIVTMPATDPAGNDLGYVRVYRNLSTAVTSGVGDPHAYMLWPTPEQAGAQTRGLNHRIDTSRYRILTTEFGIERARDLSAGSIARIMWHVDGEFKTNGNLAEIESDDIMLRHLAPTQNGGKIVLDTVQVDMADRHSLPVETDYAQPGSGWNNTCTSTPGTTTCNTSSSTYEAGANQFRLDPHEFSAATASDIRRIKLAALERTGSSYQIQWTPSNPSSLPAAVTLKAVPVDSNHRPVDPSCSTGSSIAIATDVSLAGGSYTWTPGTTTGVADGSEYFVCAQILVGGTVVDEVLSRWPVVVDAADGGIKPLMQLDRTTLVFGAATSGTAFTAATGSQTVRMTQSGTGTVTWTATPSQPWITVSPSSGTGGANFTIGVTFVSGLQATQSGTVSLSLTGASGTVGPINVTLNLLSQGATRSPFGLVDTPLQNTTGVVGSIGVTGWALDDVGVSSVKLYRNCLWFEPAADCQVLGGINVVYMGDADLVPESRPDVEAVYPSYPQAYRAGWGYLILTNMLPHIPRQVMFGGQGSFSIYVLATDVEGHTRWLGRGVSDQTPTTIAVDNDAAAKPFGAIDTPGQGQVVSGAMWNFGWALTPDTNTTADASDIVVPTDGSTIVVWIDGAPAGYVTYNTCRGTVGSSVPADAYCDDDVANIFGNPTPQPTFAPRSANESHYRNLDEGRGAMGYYRLDTTTMTNGRHSIVWSVTDNAGRVDGIGSRYFIASNDSSVVAGATASHAPAYLDDAAEVAWRPIADVAVRGRTGFDPRARWETVEPDATGARDVRIPELGRLELSLGVGVTTGYSVANGALRPLPIGSRLANGRFTWAPPAGYFGTYDVVFLDGTEQIPVKVTIYPASEKRRIDAAIDVPRAGATVSGGFTIAGRAADQTAWHGTGVGAVQVWAFRRDGEASPRFLGAADLNVSRPDAGAQLGAQFERAGWQLATPALPPGEYDLVAYFWSTKTQRFENTGKVRVTVR